VAYDWTKPDEGNAERLPVDIENEVTVTGLRFGNKNGPYRSTAGDPRIMLILADDEGRECATMVTLSEKAAWVLKSILSSAGVNLQKMVEHGVEPEHFANEEFAKANLIGRRLKIRVKSYASADGNLAEIVAVRPRPQANAPAPPAPPVPPAPPMPPALEDNTDDIPF